MVSGYLKFEVLPKARYHSSALELALYNEFFLSAAITIPFANVHFDLAFDHACRYGLSAFDALHLTVAAEASCNEFVTSERSSSPLFRFQGLKILTID